MSAFSYDLNDVLPSHGKEISQTISNGIVHISFSLLPADDLLPCIIKSLIFDLFVPTDYHTHSTGLQIAVHKDSINSSIILNNIIEPYVIQGSAYDEKKTNRAHLTYLSFPWIQPYLPTTRTSLPLSVSFYTVRQLFKNPSIPNWLAPISITNNIINNYHLIDQSKSSRNNHGDSSDSSKKCRLGIITGCGHTCGKRPEMEDKEFIFPTINITNDRVISAYGVLDGHGGSDCSHAIADELPSKITQCLRNNSASANDLNMPDVLYNSFKTCDDWYLKSDRTNSGSTATVLLWDNYTNTACVANVGDTRAVLCRNGVAVTLTYDRKASDAEEIARILRNGGQMKNNRVMGSLAVTRAFGDRHLKKALVAPTPHDPTYTLGMTAVIVDPEITIVDIRQDVDEFIIIACDGLWDVMTSQTAVNMIRDMIKAQTFDNATSTYRTPTVSMLNNIADNVAQHAVRVLGSTDNVTVMILVFHQQPTASSPKYSTSDNSNKVLHTSKYIVSKYSNPSPVADSTIRNSGKYETMSKSNSEYSIESTRILPTNTVDTRVESKQPVDHVEDIMDFLLDDNNF